MGSFIATIGRWLNPPARGVVEGVRVNHLHFGSLIHVDGRVAAISPWGRALVHWPQGDGSEWLPGRQLVVTESASASQPQH
ncbi:MAG: hypothetical protein ACRYGL_07440 [Janthinobacterium lividum]